MALQLSNDAEFVRVPSVDNNSRICGKFLAELHGVSSHLGLRGRA